MKLNHESNCAIPNARVQPRMQMLSTYCYDKELDNYGGLERNRQNKQGLNYAKIYIFYDFSIDESGTNCAYLVCSMNHKLRNAT